MAKRATKAPSLPADMGTVRKALDKPERAAELTVAEVTELKERRRLLERFESEANDAYKVMVLLRGEYQRHAQGLVTAHGLNPNDDHNIDSESGVIWRTATYVPVEAEELAPIEAPAIETNGTKE